MHAFHQDRLQKQNDWEAYTRAMECHYMYWVLQIISDFAFVPFFDLLLLFIPDCTSCKYKYSQFHSNVIVDSCVFMTPLITENSTIKIGCHIRNNLASNSTLYLHTGYCNHMTVNTHMQKFAVQGVAIKKLDCFYYSFLAKSMTKRRVGH